MTQAFIFYENADHPMMIGIVPDGEKYRLYAYLTGNNETASLLGIYTRDELRMLHAWLQAVVGDAPYDE